MNFKIEKFDKNNIELISDLPPQEWNFNIVDFVQKHFCQDYFQAFSISVKHEIIAFGNVFIFENISWLGNIIIKKQYRNKGLGTKITEHLIDFSLSMGVNSFLLIATDEGESIYKKLGFEIQSYYKFFTRENFTEKSDGIIELSKINNKEFREIVSIDFDITGENRSELLKQYQDSIFTFRSDKGVKAYFIEELGNGFIASSASSCGSDLLNIVSKNKLNIVIPEDNKMAEQLLVKNNFVFHHKAPRMILGRKVIWKPENIFSRGTGYCG